MTKILQAATALHDAGLCVLPAADDGSKTPALTTWKHWQSQRPDLVQVTHWASTSHGIGVLCGKVSGNLEMLEVEGPAIGLLPAVTAAMTDHGLGEVWERIGRGYAEATPNGGIHWLLRVDGAPLPNRKIARRPIPGGVAVLFETRGEGGWVVVAPSNGGTHPTGRAWTMLTGSPATIPTVTVDERDAVYAVLSLFDEMPAPVEAPPATSSQADGLRPGDDYNARADWSDILTGWTRVRRMGAGFAWRRPGKNEGISATTGQADDADRIYVFTTSTTLPSEKALTKFAAYTHLEHGGDYAAAARALRSAGYGDAPTPAGPSLADMVEKTATTGAAAPTPPAFVERTEDAQALALVRACESLIRHNYTTGRWHTYTDGVWVQQPASGGMVREYARGLARHLPGNDGPAMTWRKAMLADTGIRHVIALATTDQKITAQTSDFDTNPTLLSHGDLVTDLTTGTTRASTSADMISKSTLCRPGSTGKRLWESFLSDILDSDAHRYLARLAGLTLFGAVREHLLVFCYGTGANGKTTLADALRHALGDYAITLPAETLMIRKHEPHSTELAPLAGARMAVVNELPDGRRFDEARVKVLTGGDQVGARWLYGQPFTFTPSHTLWVIGNAKPAAVVGGEAFWRRIRLVGFHRTIDPDKRDPDMPDKLREAAPAILEWAINGWADYRANGLAEPASVVADTAEYRAENDTVARFLDDVCQVSGNHQVRVFTATVRAAYESWCRDEAVEPVTPTAFGIALKRVGVDQIRTHGKRFYTGLTLLETVEEEDSWR